MKIKLEKFDGILESGKNYENYEFISLDFSNQEFEEIQFLNCVFERSFFQYSKIKDSSFENCKFNNCDLSLLKILDTSFSNTNFNASKLLASSWEGKNMIFSIDFNKCILDKSSFFGLNMENFKISNSSFIDSIFSNTNLINTVFDNCNLDKCQFLNCKLNKADFKTSYNYFINMNNNQIKDTKFSLPEAISLLKNFDIIIE